MRLLFKEGNYSSPLLLLAVVSEFPPHGFSAIHRIPFHLKCDGTLSLTVSSPIKIRLEFGL
jgi:hypothetical protein